ncbi:MAG: hypothetical protein IJU52_02200 [Clostridia bacterium]|nr:hypothetical protein [Clostridia bacterium]
MMSVFVSNKRRARVICAAALLAALFLITACVSCGKAEYRGAACEGCAAGKRGEQSEAWYDKEEILLPSVFVRAYAVLCAQPSKEICLRMIYDGSEALWAKMLLDECAMTPEELISKMNDRARLEAPGLPFGSVTGRTDTEEKLCGLLDRPAAFRESTGDLSSLKKAAEAFFDDENLLFALSVSSVKTADGGEKSRMAPLVNKNDQYYLENAQMELGDYTSKNGLPAYVAVGAVKEGGEVAFAAVCEVLREGSPVWFASCDIANACGAVLGRAYNMVYSPPDDLQGAGMTLGASFFSGAVLIILGAIAVVLVAAVIGGIALRMKRNAEGRKKYAPPKEK